MRHLMRQKIGVQLLSLYLVFVIPVLLGGAGLYLFQRNNLQQNAFQSDQGLAQSVALEIAAHVQSSAGIVQDLATNEATNNLDTPQLNLLFSYAFGAYPDISLYAILDPTGKMIYNYPTNLATIGQNFSASDYFQGALQSNTPYVSSRRTSTTTHTSVYSLATTMRNSTGAIVGVMVIEVSLDIFNLHLQTIQRQLTPASEMGIWIIDAHGQTIATTKADPTAQNLPDLPGSVASVARQGLPGQLSSTDQHRDWLYSFVPIPEANWAVVVQRPADVTFAILVEFQRGLIVALTLVIVGAVFFWIMMHQRLIAPLTRLADAVSRFDPEDPHHTGSSGLLRNDHARHDEVGRLITAFLVMEHHIRSHLQRNDETIQAQFHTLEAILRSMDEAVLLESPSGEIVYANSVFSRAVGIPQSELVASSLQRGHLRDRLLAMFTSPATFDEVFVPVERGNGPQNFEFHLRGIFLNQEHLIPVQRDIRMRYFLVRDAAGQLIGRGKIFQDVTVENQAERIKRNLLAIVSHELRTPLTAIKGYATSLLDEADGEIDLNWQKHSLSQIVVESNRLADLVTNLLDMSQVEAHTLKLYPEWHLLSSLVEEARDMVFTTPDLLQLQITLPDPLPLLNVDGRRILVILRNLFENARRYGGPDLRIELRASYAALQLTEPPGLLLSVADNGPGIPAHLVERIFDRFYQVETGHERSRNGVGLGLAICRGFMEAHQGRIWATNRTDGEHGAVFLLWFPSSILRIHATQVVEQD